jgi:hypothetical protein
LRLQKTKTLAVGHFNANGFHLVYFDTASASRDATAVRYLCQVTKYGSEQWPLDELFTCHVNTVKSRDSSLPRALLCIQYLRVVARQDSAYCWDTVYGTLGIIHLRMRTKEVHQALLDVGVSYFMS